MTLTEFQGLVPLLIPAGAGLIVLLLGAAKVPSPYLFWFTLVSLVSGIGTLAGLAPSLPLTVAHFLSFDPFSRFFLWLLYGATLLVTLFAKERIASEHRRIEIFYATLLLALTGMGVVATAAHLASFFLGLEIYTAGLYVLIGYRTDRSLSLEAAVKYLILGAVSSGFILLGIALLYLECGHLELVTLAEQLVDPAGLVDSRLWLAGTAFLLVGVGFKLSLAPFHMWAPDVYQGAPAPITLWIATGSKAAVVALLIRYLSLAGNGPNILGLLEVLVIGSVVVGNLLALYQTNLKRLLAYSSIAHLGYTLVPLSVGGQAAWSAAVFYLTTYLITVAAAFGLIMICEEDTADAGALEHYRGLVHSKPLAAAGIALAFFSLAGIPLTAGFVGKWSIFWVALSGGHYALVGAVVLGASLGVFYYLRVVAQVYFSAAESNVPCNLARPALSWVGLAAVLASIVILGVYPEPLLHYLDQVTGMLITPQAPFIMISAQ